MSTTGRSTLEQWRYGLSLWLLAFAFSVMPTPDRAPTVRRLYCET